MGKNDTQSVQLEAFELMRVDSQSLTRVIEEASSKLEGLKGDKAAAAFTRHCKHAAVEAAQGEEARALFTRAQIYQECLHSCTRQLADARLHGPAGEDRTRLMYGLAHARVKIAPRLDGTMRINYNIREIISIATSLPAPSGN